MSAAKGIVWTSIVLALGASIGFALARDWRRAAYFFFSACITLTQVV